MGLKSLAGQSEASTRHMYKEHICTELSLLTSGCWGASGGAMEGYPAKFTQVHGW
ncbi:unnamed protein product [Penicillium camemberti]|uniref:Str. FM013 n=1 Tax=Penicillium camemberti (strain FM 013) TaxID=1429867 RepID=A0A0G4P7S2_PENC3|nr:unnamed protein product [Penicillium camemberti]